MWGSPIKGFPMSLEASYLPCTYLSDVIESEGPTVSSTNMRMTPNLMRVLTLAQYNIWLTWFHLLKLAIRARDIKPNGDKRSSQLSTSYITISLSICEAIYLSTYLPIYLSTYLSICQSVNKAVYSGNGPGEESEGIECLEWSPWGSSAASRRF